MHHLFRSHSEMVACCMAVLGLLSQIKIQAMLMEKVTSDNGAVSLLCTRAVGEGLYVMTMKQSSPGLVQRQRRLTSEALLVRFCR